MFCFCKHALLCEWSAAPRGWRLADERDRVASRIRFSQSLSYMSRWHTGRASGISAGGRGRADDERTRESSSPARRDLRWWAHGSASLVLAVPELGEELNGIVARAIGKRLEVEHLTDAHCVRACGPRRARPHTAFFGGPSTPVRWGSTASQEQLFLRRAGHAALT